MRSDVLIGVAIDVSGSMQQSIRNDANQSLTRLKSLRETLGRIAEEARSALSKRQSHRGTGSADVFVYAFGLKEPPVADLLSLVGLLRRVLPTATSPAAPSPAPTPSKPLKFTDPFADLEDQARHWDVPGWGLEAKTYLSRDEAANLARLLRQNPAEAQQLASRIKTDGDTIRSARTTATTVGAMASLLPGVFGTLGAGAGGIAKHQVNARVSATLRDTIKRLAAAANPEEARKIAEQEYVDATLKELAKAPDTTVPLTTIDQWMNDLDTGSSAADRFLYGNTPFCAAMQRVLERFRREMRSRDSDTRKVLFVVSDGEPTDGDPLPYATALLAEKITVVCCFVTDANLVRPRRLYAQTEDGWNDGARRMFHLASPLEDASGLAGYLREIRWEVPSGARMFAQINHSDVLDSFVDAVFRTAAGYK